MRIGIDGACLSNKRGFGRFTRQIVEAMAALDSRHEFVLFLDAPSAGLIEVPARFQRCVVPVSEAPAQAAAAHGRRSLSDLWRMGRAMSGAGLNLVYFPATYSFVPVWNVKRVVVTLHDTLPFKHPELVFPTRKGRLAWCLKEYAALRWASGIATVSEASKRDLVTRFRLRREQVRVIPEGADAVFHPRVRDARALATLARHGLDPGSPYLLYVGGLSPHKNLLRLIDSIALCDESAPRLAIVGDFHDVFHTQVPQIRQAIQKHGLQDRVVLTGFVPDEELAILYSQALACVLPSLLEGFGLPAVEAMACGTPVLHSTAGSLPEVIGDGGLAFDPLSVPEMAAAIQRIAKDPALRAKLAQKAIERSRLFTWKEAATRLLAYFEEMLGNPARPGGIPARHQPVTSSRYAEAPRDQ